MTSQILETLAYEVLKYVRMNVCPALTLQAFCVVRLIYMLNVTLRNKRFGNCTCDSMKHSFIQGILVCQKMGAT